MNRYYQKKATQTYNSRGKEAGFPFVLDTQTCKRKKQIKWRSKRSPYVFPSILQITNSTSMMSWSVWKLSLKKSPCAEAIVYTHWSNYLKLNAAKLPNSYPLMNTLAESTFTFFYGFHWYKPEHLQLWFEIIFVQRWNFSHWLEWSFRSHNTNKQPKTHALFHPSSILQR